LSLNVGGLYMKRRFAFSGAVLCAGLPLVVWAAPGCSSPMESDPRFAAVTNDEYMEGASQNALSPVPEAGTAFDSGPFQTDGGFGDGGFGDGGFGDGGFGDGGFGDDGGFPGPSGFPSGKWTFDDCNPQSNFLSDSTGNGANAQHAKGGSCVPG